MTEEVQVDQDNITDSPTEAGPSDQTSTEGVTLGVGDLQNVMQIIDLAMTRGAFRANEAVQVGTVYNKLTQFVGSVQNSIDANNNT